MAKYRVYNEVDGRKELVFEGRLGKAYKYIINNEFSEITVIDRKHQERKFEEFYNEHRWF